jgi:CO/xanthine dehydrogenase FAD-binding subunit
MTISVLTPKTIAELVKIMTSKGKLAVLISGVDPSDRPVTGKVMVDMSRIEAMNEIGMQKDRVIIGAGINLGRLAREAVGENGLLRQAASLIANPLVRNRVTLVQSLDPESPYFDIATPLVLLDAKVRLQSPSGKRTLAIRDFLEQASRGLKKGEMPVTIEFTKLPASHRVAFFRVAGTAGKGSVSAATQMRMVRNIPMDPEIAVSSLRLIPMRSKEAEKEIGGKPATEETIKRAAAVAAEELDSYVDKPNAYEHTLIEIAVARTLRDIV